ncbi:choice-of-anchor L domain-containing protein [Tenacibaculum salmonis]|uniref:choice-of-anchor L domain-containing protein n=1 Tax=Tenacibaculum sp. P3-BQ1 TaxID=3232310 RepID=UPI0034DEE58E
MKILLSTFVFFIIFLPLKAQTTIQVNNVNDVEALYNPKDLIEKVLIDNNCTSITNINSSVSGSPSDRQNKSYGYFKSKVGSTFPFKEGIVLSTGKAFPISGTSLGNLNSPTTGKGDTDLSTSLNEPSLNDASVIEFDFIPTSDEISFRYLMASEEYQGTFPCTFADGFAFLLRKSGTTTYKNLAVIPNSTTPVSVKNVHAAIIGGCPAKNETYFAGNNLGDTNFDGRTKVLTAKATVTPNVTYHIKLVIADNSDNQYDTAVFLEKGSFNLGLDLGTDLSSTTQSSVCGTEKLLTSNITANNYQWYKDDVIIPLATKKDYLANLGNGKYTCKIIDGSCSDEDDILLEFSESPINNISISPLLTCNNNLNIQLDLTSKTNEILAGQDDTKFEVLFYSDALYTTQITTPINYTNLTNNDIIYTRIRNIIATNCFVDNSFNSIITGNPIIQTPVNYEECDDTFNGTDTDGYFNNFLLNTKDSEILGALDPVIYEVSYHTTLIGAQTDKNTAVIDKNTAYKNTVTNTQKVYVRVQNKSNANCNDTSKSFNLVVNSLPVTTNTVTLEQCDTDADLNTTINLTLAQKNISVNHLNETFKYYPTENNAINDTAEIINKTTHPVTNGSSVWVKVFSDKKCSRIAKIDIIVGYATDVAYNANGGFKSCDDFLDIDGNDNLNNNDTDGISVFDLSSVSTDVKALFPIANRPNLKVLIFESIIDRNAVQNEITNLSNYRNKNLPAKTPQSLYIKIIDKTNNNCTGLGSFTIWAQQPPIAKGVANFELCDDFNSGSFIDGKSSNINLRDRVSDILGTTQAISDYTVTFHTTAVDANSGNSPIINDTNYTNQTKDKETIYVRVVNNNTGCFNNHLTFDIIINRLPIISNKIPDLEICDIPTIADGNSRNGFAQNINLSERDIDILNGRDATLFEVSYHNTLQDATTGNNPLPKNNYSNKLATTIVPPAIPLNDNPAIENIHISLLDKTTGCRYGISKFQLIIHPEPLIPLNITDYTDCDNQTDNNSDDANGINGDITLKNKTLEILDEYPKNQQSNYIVSFHESLADAKSGTAPINENNYENTINNQTIFVRVLNTKTSCVNTNLTFNIRINPLPSFMVDTTVIVCLNNPQTKLEAINPNATYGYQWTLKGNPSDILSTDTFYDVQKGGTYIVTATMLDTTTCKRSYEIVVNESEIATLNEDDIVIVDDTNNSGLDAYAIKIITENQNLGIGDYQFSLIDEDGNQTIFQDEPVFENITGGIYTIVVNDKNGCSPNAMLDVSVIQYPKFFTPNGDGHNDTWRVKGANSSFYPSSNITIVNRYGKIVAIIAIDDQGWNGYYNGKILPSSDYWFKIELIDRKGKAHQHQGHFSLLRR